MQESKELYTGPKTLQMSGTPSHKVKRPELVKYRVFVQNAGGGARCVKGGTYVLYEVSLYDHTHEVVYNLHYVYLF